MSEFASLTVKAFTALLEVSSGYDRPHAPCHNRPEATGPSTASVWGISRSVRSFGVTSQRHVASPFLTRRDSRTGKKSEHKSPSILTEYLWFHGNRRRRTIIDFCLLSTFVMFWHNLLPRNTASNTNPWPIHYTDGTSIGLIPASRLIESRWLADRFVSPLSSLCT